MKNSTRPWKNRFLPAFQRVGPWLAGAILNQRTRYRLNGILSLQPIDRSDLARGVRNKLLKQAEGVMAKIVVVGAGVQGQEGFSRKALEEIGRAEVLAGRPAH